MRTEIYPNCCCLNNQRLGIMVGQEFVPMREHKGDVELTWSRQLKPRFLNEGNLKEGNKKIGLYRSRRYELLLVGHDYEPDSETYIFEDIVSSGGLRLIIQGRIICNK